MGKSVPSTNEALSIVSEPEYFAAMMVSCGYADGMVGGASRPTSTVLRAGLQSVGLTDGVRVLSGAFLMLFERPLSGGQDILAFADCAVTPEPNSQQLVDIALNTAGMMETVTGEDPRIAFLSFSTKGSAKHHSLDEILRAVELLHERNGSLLADGELQVDAALVPEIARQKDPEGVISGTSNTLIFPNLHAANIAYKLVERTSGAKALGVIVSGFAKPVNDLSRGCSAEDVLDMICLTSLQC